MKKIELVYREMLYQVMEKGNKVMTQLAIAEKLGISLSTVSQALEPLRKMGAVEVRLKNFIVTDKQKILYHWASVRNLEKDIIYQTRVEQPVRKVEQEMPAGIVFGAYSAYKYKFKDVPADYSEVYVYGEVEEVKKRFPSSKSRPNLFVLKKDESMGNYGQVTTLAQTFVDLWNLKEWYAQEFLTALKKRIGGEA